MNKKSYSKHCFLFLGLSCTALLAVIALTVFHDPFFQYHAPLEGLEYVIDNKINQNPGMARHFTYDSAILGSSMTVNFDTSLFHETMGLNTAKLSYDGAYPKDIDNIMGFVEESGNEVKTIFLGIDIFTYKKEPGITAYELPEYLYDSTPLTDVSYVLNKEVLLEYILRPQIEGEGTPLNEVYWTWNLMEFGEEAVLRRYTPPTTYEEALPVDTYAENIANNLELFILPHIQENADTEFVVFFPPYSILYWNDRLADGSLSAELQGIKQITKTLLTCPNVEVFYFQNQYEYITDLDNYCDHTHYNHDMNDYMTRCFADGTNQLTLDNVEKVLTEMESWLMTQLSNK